MCVIRDGPYSNRDDDNVVYILPRRRSTNGKLNLRRGTIDDSELDNSAVPGLAKYERREDRDDDAQRIKMSLIALAVNLLLMAIGALLACNITGN
jgi:hypothetical protein